MMPNAIFQSVNEGYCIGSEPSELITHVDANIQYGSPVPGVEGWEVCGSDWFESGEEDFFWHFMRPNGINDQAKESEDLSQNGVDFWFYCKPDGEVITYGFSFEERSFEPGGIVEHQDLEGGLHRFTVLACQTFYAVEFKELVQSAQRVHRVVVEAITDGVL